MQMLLYALTRRRGAGTAQTHKTAHIRGTYSRVHTRPVTALLWPLPPRYPPQPPPPSPPPSHWSVVALAGRWRRRVVVDRRELDQPQPGRGSQRSLGSWVQGKTASCGCRQAGQETVRGVCTLLRKARVWAEPLTGEWAGPVATVRPAPCPAGSHPRLPVAGLSGPRGWDGVRPQQRPAAAPSDSAEQWQQESATGDDEAKGACVCMACARLVCTACACPVRGMCTACACHVHGIRVRLQDTLSTLMANEPDDLSQLLSLDEDSVCNSSKTDSHDKTSSHCRD